MQETASLVLWLGLGAHVAGPKKSARLPFNNPFAAHLKKFKRRVAAADRQRRATHSPGAENNPGVANERNDQPAPERGEEEIFRDAISGAVPLERSSQAVRIRNPRPTSGSRLRGTEENIDFTTDDYFDVRFSDQFIRARCQGVSRETLAKLERGEFAVRSHIDLHGMAFDDARDAVDDFLSYVQRRGEQCVLVITGKGRNSPGQVGVLRENIPQWLARGPSARSVLAFVTARPCDGGEGALYVLLRQRSSRKQRIEVESGGGT